MVMIAGAGNLDIATQSSFVPQDHIQSIAPRLRFEEFAPALTGPLQSLANSTDPIPAPHPATQEVTLPERSAQDIIQGEIDKALAERQDVQVASIAPPVPTTASEIIQLEIDKALIEHQTPRPEGPVSAADLQAFFPNASRDVLAEMADELNLQIEVGMIDTPERMAHFLGQVREEVGSSLTVEENLNYAADRLPQIFTYFTINGDEARQFGRTPTQAADPVAIANRAYANRNGNGDIASGEGWAYRGRGMIQLTGKANYEAFTDTHARLFGEQIDFVANPDLLLEPKYAVRSALAYWIENGLPQIADGGMNRETADAITRRINPYTDSYADRWAHAQQVFNSGIFADV